MIDGDFRRYPDLRGDAQVLAGFDDGVVQEAKQVRIFDTARSARPAGTSAQNTAHVGTPP